ncbi:cilia- and flagella-associated protein 91-like [Drosophila miranda]|uniref:cilia- and flagella-associated protein 91-like n=1 Tax=Drosophila miranda TaxID=7229 RepID=UPI0007E6810B|nr:cilia- and flagella-associated protein 91-like [Drosophila miranda]
MSAQRELPRRKRILHFLQEERETRGNNKSSSSPLRIEREQSPKLSQHATLNNREPAHLKDDYRGSSQSLSSCLITRSSLGPRLKSGANNPAKRSTGRLPRTDSECLFKATGIDFLTEKDTNTTTHEVKLDSSVYPRKTPLMNKCDFFPKYVDNRPFKEQATQTLYREASAQTLAYLPETEDKVMDEHLELFRLASALPGDKPPGLYEVEVLERSRRRWAFNKALNTNLKRQLQEARELAMKTKYKSILEAFEWESWIEREDCIQECQKRRLEIVIKMFDKREKEMHLASKKRIEMACEGIAERRQAALHKNEIEYQRGKRRLDIQLAKTSLKWQKQSPLYSLGSPCSEFYGPLIRHGVDPARQSFLGTNRKAFDIRMDDLEKRVKMNNVTCPFRKLKEWSKPREYVKEYEQNFCSEKKLQNLYDSLTALRKQQYEHKNPPKSLKKRHKPRVHSVDARMSSFSGSTTMFYNPEKSRMEQPQKGRTVELNRSSALAKSLQDDRRQVDLEYLLQKYEGTYIGWIMQFLSEEMGRLKEQRRLHFFTILAQKERWRREANEAGLRQKENELRRVYDELFQKSNPANKQVGNEYLNRILTTDMIHIADHEATKTVTGLAKDIDADIQRWLESFKLIQTPLTYDPLRLMLRDMVSPDMNAALDRHEKALIANYIVEDVIFGRVWEELEPFDISTTLTSDFIDRLIDNDLYLFSTDSESDTPQETSSYEANAIIRKLIRQAVPGQRWKDEIERIVHENQNDLFDDVFAAIMSKIENPPPVRPSQLIEVGPMLSHTVIKTEDNIRAMEILEFEAMRDQIHTQYSEELKTTILSLFKKITVDHITKKLETDELFTEDETIPMGEDVFMKSQSYGPPESDPKLDSDLYSIMGIVDICKEKNFNLLKGTGHPKLEYKLNDYIFPSQIVVCEKDDVEEDEMEMEMEMDITGETDIVTETEMTVKEEMAISIEDKISMGLEEEMKMEAKIDVQMGRKMVENVESPKINNPSLTEKTSEYAEENYEIESIDNMEALIESDHNLIKNLIEKAQEEDELDTSSLSKNLLKKDSFEITALVG